MFSHSLLVAQGACGLSQIPYEFTHYCITWMLFSHLQFQQCFICFESHPLMCKSYQSVIQSLHKYWLHEFIISLWSSLWLRIFKDLHLKKALLQIACGLLELFCCFCPCFCLAAAKLNAAWDRKKRAETLQRSHRVSRVQGCFFFF